MAEQQKGSESKDSQDKSWLLNGPVLSTGRGGGALRGTKGEFNCDAHTGSAKLSIPLPFSCLSCDFSARIGTSPTRTRCWNRKRLRRLPPTTR